MPGHRESTVPTAVRFFASSAGVLLLNASLPFLARRGTLSAFVYEDALLDSTVPWLGWKIG